jgi:hypothetical protein
LLLYTRLDYSHQDTLAYWLLIGCSSAVSQVLSLYLEEEEEAEEKKVEEENLKKRARHGR